MKKDILTDAISMLPDDLVAQAAKRAEKPKTKTKKGRIIKNMKFGKWFVAAACFAVMTALVPSAFWAKDLVLQSAEEVVSREVVAAFDVNPFVEIPKLEEWKDRPEEFLITQDRGITKVAVDTLSACKDKENVVFRLHLAGTFDRAEDNIDYWIEEWKYNLTSPFASEKEIEFAAKALEIGCGGTSGLRFGTPCYRYYEEQEGTLMLMVTVYSLENEPITSFKKEYSLEDMRKMNIGAESYDEWFDMSAYMEELISLDLSGLRNGEQGRIEFALGWYSPLSPSTFNPETNVINEAYDLGEDIEYPSFHGNIRVSLQFIVNLDSIGFSFFDGGMAQQNANRKNDIEVDRKISAKESYLKRWGFNYLYEIVIPRGKLYSEEQFEPHAVDIDEACEIKEKLLKEKKNSADFTGCEENASTSFIEQVSEQVPEQVSAASTVQIQGTVKWGAPTTSVNFAKKIRVQINRITSTGSTLLGTAITDDSGHYSMNVSAPSTSCTLSMSIVPQNSAETVFVSGSSSSYQPCILENCATKTGNFSAGGTFDANITNIAQNRVISVYEALMLADGYFSAHSLPNSGTNKLRAVINPSGMLPSISYGTPPSTSMTSTLLSGM